MYLGLNHHIAKKKTNKDGTASLLTTVILQNACLNLIANVSKYMKK